MLSVSQAPLPWVFGFSATPLQAYSYSGISKPPNRQTLMGGFVWFPRGADLWGPASASCFSGRMENSGKSCDPCHVMSCYVPLCHTCCKVDLFCHFFFHQQNLTRKTRIISSRFRQSQLYWQAPLGNQTDRPGLQVFAVLGGESQST